MDKCYTKGNVVVNDIKIGDIHYEYEYGSGIKCEVITKPVRSSRGQWTWKSKNVFTDQIISYMLTEKYSHYGPNLYDYEAYIVDHYVGESNNEE